MSAQEKQVASVDKTARYDLFEKAITLNQCNTRITVDRIKSSVAEVFGKHGFEKGRLIPDSTDCLSRQIVFYFEEKLLFSSPMMKKIRPYVPLIIQKVNNIVRKEMLKSLEFEVKMIQCADILLLYCKNNRLSV